MTGATIIAGRSDTVATLIDACMAGGELVLRLDDLGDAQDEAVRQAAVEKAKPEHGGVVRVVNLIANPTPGAAMADLSLDRFDAAMLATTARTFAALRATVPAMREGGGGSFLTIWEEADAGEADGLIAPTFIGGLEMLGPVVAMEYAAVPSVRVNLIHFRLAEMGDAGLRFWAAYLLSDASTYVTGVHIGG
jgi:hypothetical protein